jgi:hypothetical protein
MVVVYQMHAYLTSQIVYKIIIIILCYKTVLARRLALEHYEFIDINKATEQRKIINKEMTSIEIWALKSSFRNQY